MRRILIGIVALTTAQASGCFQETPIYGDSSEDLYLNSDLSNYLKSYNTTMGARQFFVCGEGATNEYSVDYTTFQGIQMFLGDKVSVNPKLIVLNEFGANLQDSGMCNNWRIPKDESIKNVIVGYDSTELTYLKMCTQNVCFEQGYRASEDQIKEVTFTKLEPLVGLKGAATTGSNSILKALGFITYNCTVENTIQLANGSIIDSNGTVIQKYARCESETCWDGKARLPEDDCECKTCKKCWDGSRPTDHNEDGGCDCPKCPSSLDRCWDGRKPKVEDDCECKRCPSSECKYGFTRDSDDCTCPFCDSIFCWDNSSPEYVYCKCPPCKEGRCWDGSKADKDDCSCPACPKTICWNRQFPIASDDCNCPDCSEDLCWDGSNREMPGCTCPEEPIICSTTPCPNNATRNPDTCQCSSEYACRTSITCRDGYEFNEDTCVCEPPDEEPYP